MATDGGDIRFTFSGDSSGLNSELKKIDKNLGEVSKATAGASNGLEKGLTKGAKAADKAAAKMATSLGKAGKEMDEASVKAQKMGDKMDAVGDSAGGVSSSLSGVGGALSEVNPAMGEMTGAAGAASGALEGVMMAAKSHPAIFVAVTLATAAAAIAFSGLTAELEAQEEAWEKADKAGDKHQKLVEKWTDAIDAAADAYRDFNETGLEKTNRELDEQRDRLIILQKTYADANHELAHNEDLNMHVSEKLREASEAQLATELANIEAIREEINAGAEKDAKIKDRDERQKRVDAGWAKRRKANAEWRASEAQAAAAAQKENEDYFSAVFHFQDMERDYLAFKLDGEEQIEAMAQKKVDAIHDEFAALRESHQGEQELMDLRDVAVEAVLAERSHLLQEYRDKEAAADAKVAAEKAAAADKAADDEKRRAQEVADAKEAVLARNAQVAMSLTSAVSTWAQVVEQQSDNMTREQLERLYAVQKGVAISEATINGAVAAVAALKIGPIAGPIAAVAIAAMTAGQIALIAGEEPAFDVGGMVRGGSMASSSDQISASLLPGEAVLNRSAAGRLGEDGVNALNSGGGIGSGVVVVPAYRHFDRFIRDEYRKGGAFRRIVTAERQYPVGQRSY